MARLPRAEVFAPDAIGRVLRRCFLLGDDPVTGKDSDYRKVWIEEQLQRSPVSSLAIIGCRADTFKQQGRINTVCIAPCNYGFY